VNTRLIGKVGEKYARDFLKRRGYKVLFENWTCYGGELDLIVEKDCLVFVEVKYVRQNFCSPVELFDYKKRVTLLRTIEKFLQQNPEYIGNWRADLVGISRKYNKKWVDHYTNVL